MEVKRFDKIKDHVEIDMERKDGSEVLLTFTALEIVFMYYELRDLQSQVSKNESLHLVSERYFKIEFTNVWGSFKEAIVKATNKNTAYAEFKMKHGDQVNIIAVNDYAR